VSDRHFPSGTLNDFQEHKGRVWSTYHFDLGRVGRLATTLLGNYDSGTTFSFSGTLPRAFSPQQQAILADYFSSPASTQTIFFGERGAGEFADFWSVDLGLLYSLPVVPAWGLDVFVKGDVFNVTGEDKLIAWNTTITPVRTGPLDANGLPTTFTRGGAFGTGTSNAHYVVPREYQVAVGIRF
jgi:hypothetical protein